MSREQGQKAFVAVSSRCNSAHESDYKRFSKSFPVLIQTCGLAQALSFALAREQQAYLTDLASIVGLDSAQMIRLTLESPVPIYQKHSRDLLAASTWIKRYSEALLKGDD